MQYDRFVDKHLNVSLLDGVCASAVVLKDQTLYLQ